MEDQRILEELTIVPLLVKLVREEELTVLEQKTVDIWLNQRDSNKQFFEQLKNEKHVAVELLDYEAAASTTSDELQKLHARMDQGKSKSMLRYWLSAAAIIFTISFSVFLYRYFQSDALVQNQVVSNTMDIEPGKDQATLTFADGQVVRLEGNNVKTDQDGITYVDGQTISTNPSQYAILSTPRKGQYKTILPDGTIAWLNAESNLKYPTKFTGSDRRVELEGEGYFEVAHNPAKPFIVVSKGQQVKVLGTKFNINSYTNEAQVLTTLVSGSIELSSAAHAKAVRLKPGQQATVRDGKLEVQQVDPESFTAWTVNEFRFDDTPLTQVLRQLERWYDIDIDYNHVPKTTVYGTISREKKLSDVLYALEKITDLKFKTTGRRLQIKE